MATKISRWCSCGASCSITVANQDTPIARLVIDEFNVIHHGGPDHRPTDAKGAAAGRRKAERQRVAEERKERGLW